MSARQMWVRYFMVNLALPPIAIILFLVQDKRQHLYIALFSSLLCYMGLWIGERVFGEHPYSE